MQNEFQLQWDYEVCRRKWFRVEGMNWVTNVYACTASDVCAALKRRNFVFPIKSIKLIGDGIDESLYEDFTPPPELCGECCDFAAAEDLSQDIVSSFSYQEVIIVGRPITVGGNALVRSSNFSKSAAGSLRLSSRTFAQAMTTYWHYSGGGTLRLTGGVGVACKISGSGAIRLGSRAGMTVKCNAGASLVLGSRFAVKSSSGYLYNCRPRLSLGSATSFLSSDLGVLTAEGVVAGEITEGVVFGVDEADAMTTAVSDVALPSCCPSRIPLRLEFRHNLSKLARFYNFIKVNGYSLPGGGVDFIPLFYRVKSTSWVGTLYYRGQSPVAAGIESWNFSFELVCNEDAPESSAWKFALTAKMTSDADATARLVANFAKQTVCPRPRFEVFNFAVDLKRKAAVPSGSVIFYDESNLFAGYTAKFSITGEAGGSGITYPYSLDDQLRLTKNLLF